MAIRRNNYVLCALSVAFVMLSVSVSAQSSLYDYEYEKAGASFGIKAGVNFSNLYVEKVSDEKVRVGFNVGIYANLPVGSKVFSIQPELAYTTRGNRTTYDNAVMGRGEVKYNLNYLELPLMAVFTLGDYFNIHAGAYAAYLISSNITSDGDLGKYTHDLDEGQFNRFDYGPVVGLGFTTDLSGVGLGGGVRYNYGLRRIADTQPAKVLLGNSKNSALQIYLTLGF